MELIIKGVDLTSVDVVKRILPCDGFVCSGKYTGYPRCMIIECRNY